MSNGFIYVVDAHFIDKIEEEENILDPSACEKEITVELLMRLCSVQQPKHAAVGSVFVY